MAELKSKYEVRSNEVQEVMNKPPNFVVNWGNTLIVLTIIVALVLMNKIQLQMKEQLPATFVYQQYLHSSQQLVFSLNLAPRHSLPRGNQAFVNILSNNAINSRVLDATIDSLWTDGNAMFLSLNVSGNGESWRMRNNRLINPSKGMQVSIDIVTGKEKILASMFRKLIK